MSTFTDGSTLVVPSGPDALILSTHRNSPGFIVCISCFISWVNVLPEQRISLTTPFSINVIVNPGIFFLPLIKRGFGDS